MCRSRITALETSCSDKVFHLGGEDRAELLSSEYAGVKIAASQRKEPKFNVLEANLVQKHVEITDRIRRPSHYLHAQAALRARSDVVQLPVSGIQRPHQLPEFVSRELIERQVYHYGAAPLC